MLPARRVYHIRNDRAGRGHVPRAPAVQHDIVHNVPVQEDRVERAPYRGQRMRPGDHGGMYTRLNLVPLLLADRKQLYRISELVAIADILRGDFRNPFTIDIFDGDARMERH